MARVTHERTGLTQDTTYRGYVRSVNARGRSEWSSVLATRTPEPLPTAVPAVPTNFAGTAPVYDAIDFSWDASDTASGYDLYITTSATAPTASTAATATVGLVTTYRHTGLSGTTTYRAYIRAKNLIGDSDWSAAINVTTPVQIPGVPADFTNTAQAFNSLTFTWTATARATGYDLYLSESEVVPDENTAPTASAGAVTTYTATGLEQNTNYNAYLRAKNTSGAGGWTDAITATTALQAPPVPTNFEGTASAYNTIDFTWTAAVRAANYDLYITTSLTAPTSDTAATASVGEVTAYTHTGLLATTAYRTYLRARNNGGTSDWTAVEIVTTPARPLQIPPEPTDFSSTARTTSSLTFGWTAAAGATNYDLYISAAATAPTAGTTPTATVGAVVTYQQTGLADTTTYYAYVRARNTAGASDWVGTTETTQPVALPDLPTNFVRSARTSNSITYTWSGAAGATGYDIFITTSSITPSSSTLPTEQLGTVATYERTLLVADTTYYAYLRARNRTGAGAWTAAVVSATTMVPPPMPANLVGTAASTSIVYTWGSSTRATGYDLYITTSATAPTSSTVPTASVEEVNTYTRTGLSPSTTYNAYIRAKNNGGASTWTIATSLTTTPSDIAPVLVLKQLNDGVNVGYSGGSIAAGMWDVQYKRNTDLERDWVSASGEGSNLSGSVNLFSLSRTRWDFRVRRGTTGPFQTQTLTVSRVASTWGSAPEVTVSFLPQSDDTTNAVFSIRTPSPGITQGTAWSNVLMWSVNALGQTASLIGQLSLSTTRTQTITVRGLIPEAIYRYRVEMGRSGFGFVPYTYITFTVPRQAPRAPTGFASSASTASTSTYTWNARPGVTGYDLYISTSSLSPSRETVPTASVGAVTTHTLTGLLPNTTYYTFIRSKNSAGTSSWSDAVSVTTVSLQTPAAPTNFARSSNTNTEIVYTWTASTDATGYDLYITTSAVAPVRGTTPTASVGAVTTYTRTGLSGSTLYRAYIRAKNNSGASAWTSAVSVRTTTTPPAVPPVPTNFARSSSTQNSIAYSWTAAARATGYDLYISTSSTAPVSGTTPTVSVGAVTTYTRTGLSANTTYYAWLRAKNSSGTTGWTAVTTVTTEMMPAPPPSVPANFAGIGGADSIAYTWTAAARATGYDLFIAKPTIQLVNSANGAISFQAPAPLAHTTPTVSVGAVSSYTRTGLDGGEYYYSYIRAKNSGGNSAWSSAEIDQSGASMGPPRYLCAPTATQTSISYEWSNSFNRYYPSGTSYPFQSVTYPSGTTFDLYISLTDTAPTSGTTPTVSNLTGTTYTRTGLTANTTYYAFIRARSGNVVTDWSPSFSATASSALGTVTELRFVVAPVWQSLTFEWDAVTNATGYEVFAGRPTSRTSGTAVSASSRQYTFTNLRPQRQTPYAIRARQGNTFSPWVRTNASIFEPISTFGINRVTRNGNIYTFNASSSPGTVEYFLSPESTLPSIIPATLSTRGRGAGPIITNPPIGWYIYTRGSSATTGSDTYVQRSFFWSAWSSGFEITE